MKAAGDALAAGLHACLEWGLREREGSVLYHCLRAYASLDDTRGAEEAFREAVVAPLVAAVLPALPAKGAVPGGDLLAPVYDELARRVEKECRFLLDLVAAPHSGLHAFDFVSCSILKAVHTGIQRGRPGAFSPGKPQLFLPNYNATLAFLSFLEGALTPPPSSHLPPPTSQLLHPTSHSPGVGMDVTGRQLGLGLGIGDDRFLSDRQCCDGFP